MALGHSLAVETPGHNERGVQSYEDEQHGKLFFFALLELSILTFSFFKQWKYYNSSIYSLRVRKPVGPDRFVKIGLQLYQVDQKSYLLDFRSFEPTAGMSLNLSLMKLSSFWEFFFYLF